MSAMIRAIGENDQLVGEPIGDGVNGLSFGSPESTWIPIMNGEDSVIINPASGEVTLSDIDAYLLFYIGMDDDGVRDAGGNGFQDIFTDEEVRRMVAKEEAAKGDSSGSVVLNRHVERLAQRSTAATDEALAAALAGVARHRRAAGEARGASVLEGAKLGHLDQHGQRGGLADAGDADQDVEAGLQGGIGGKRRVQGSVDRGELALDLAQTRSDLTLEQRRGHCQTNPIW